MRHYGFSEEKNKRAQVFQDTQRLYTKNRQLAMAVLNSKTKQRFIGEKDQVATCEAKPNQDKAKIVVSKKRSFEAASAYTDKKVCVHNFASASNPGGGVVNGASAQEECLCRCSTLYPCLATDEMDKKFYGAHKRGFREGTLNALYNDDCIYTPDVVVFKTDEAIPELMDANDWYKVDILTCAAPNLRSVPSNTMNPNAGRKPVTISDEDLKKLHIKRAKRMLDIAKANGAQVVILGAFGCGAFQNPPKVVAEAMREAISEYLYDFQVIEFAVYCSPRDTANYDAFESIIRF